MSGISRVPAPRNEPVKSYAPKTPERESIQAALKETAKEVANIPLTIGGEKIETGDLTDVVMPHDHGHVLGKWHGATPAHVQAAITAAEAARPAWAALPFEARASILLKAADLLTGPWRDRINAATMLGQSKTVYQAEIEAACELADFWRFNVAFAERILEDQPISPPGMWNRVEYRPLDGFVLAITPFNFTAIAGNLPTAPALMGNTVLWKPAPTQMLAAHVTMQILEEAGMPPGVINMVAGDPAMIGESALSSPYLAGVHFTGSTKTFQHLWSTVGKNIEIYRQYPRIVGETGGKDFVFVHESANVDEVVTALVRGGYEFQGQKCSAVSRVYVPKTFWAKMKDQLVDTIKTVKVGDVTDFKNFMGAVIDDRAFAKIKGYVDLARSDAACEVLAGGTYDDSKGWFIQPTLVETADPKHRMMREEIFGPVVTVFPYDDDKEAQALKLCDETAAYGLTGGVFAKDRYAVERIAKALRGTAGNFYINDKPTGAVVGQQPFGGSRASGTNDKAGSMQNLHRWVSVRAIKEVLVPPTDYRYPFMQ